MPRRTCAGACNSATAERSSRRSNPARPRPAPLSLPLSVCLPVCLSLRFSLFRGGAFFFLYLPAVPFPKDLDYKDGKYAHYFEVHSPMGIMRLRAEDEAGKRAWINSLQKQAQVPTNVSATIPWACGYIVVVCGCYVAACLVFFAWL